MKQVARHLTFHLRDTIKERIDEMMCDVRRNRGEIRGAFATGEHAGR